MVSFISWLRGFNKWESESQEKGTRALQQYLNKLGRLNDMPAVWASFAYLIQKDHESQEWFVKLIGDHVTRLENEINRLGRNAPSESSTLVVDAIGILKNKVEEQDGTIKTLREEIAKMKKSVAKLKA